MIVLTSLNARYTHTNLAVRYLKAAAQAAGFDVKIAEFSLNDESFRIVRELYELKPDLLGFSCYIWNIDKSLNIMKEIKKIRPDLKIIVGGPEVSYDAAEMMSNYGFIDTIIKGEGEYAFVEYIKHFYRDRCYDGIPGVVWRDKGKIIDNGGLATVDRLDLLPEPYRNPEGLEERIVYYETSRGCPFNCSYCLSSTTRGVRYFTLDRVKTELAVLAAAKPMVIKFVDRTFNVSSERAKEIFKYVIALPGTSAYHFEISAELLNDELLEVLDTAPEGKIQLEIGVQSTCEKALQAVNRTQNLKKMHRVMNALQKMNHIHVHLDLIAGLPFEDYQIFRNSFNTVYGWEPDYLQLGFLKLLKGTRIREQADEYGYVFQDHAPYEVLANRWLSFADIIRLKDIEDLVQRYYNSGAFRYTLKAAIGEVWKGDAFSFYEDLADYFKAHGLTGRLWARTRLYEFLAGFLKDVSQENWPRWHNLIIFDFILNNPKNELPDSLKKEPDDKHRIKLRNILTNIGDNKENYVFIAGRLAGEINVKPRIHVFDLDILHVAGLSRPVQRSEYPVLFKWAEGRCTVQYIDWQ